MAMDKQSFSENIAIAMQELGAEEAASCIARSLLFLAHTNGSDMEFTCDQGVVVIERRTIPASEKH
jgi:hypothetical protein